MSFDVKEFDFTPTEVSAAGPRPLRSYQLPTPFGLKHEHKPLVAEAWPTIDVFIQSPKFFYRDVLTVKINQLYGWYR